MIDDTWRKRRFRKLWIGLLLKWLRKLRGSLVLVVYYRIFISGFNTTASPNFVLFRKGVHLDYSMPACNRRIKAVDHGSASPHFPRLFTRCIIYHTQCRSFDNHWMGYNSYSNASRWKTSTCIVRKQDLKWSSSMMRWNCSASDYWRHWKSYSSGCIMDDNSSWKRSHKCLSGYSTKLWMIFQMQWW